MKKAILIGFVAAMVLMFTAMAFAASTAHQAISTAPTNFGGSVDCSGGDCILNLSWDPLSSTSPSNATLTGYAVEVKVNTYSGGLSCPDTISTADYKVDGTCTTCALTVDLTTSGLIPDDNPLISVDATVKGMITPVKKGSGYSSNNALSTTTISGPDSCL
jgi:hypothetical protein